MNEGIVRLMSYSRVPDTAMNLKRDVEMIFKSTILMVASCLLAGWGGLVNAADANNGSKLYAKHCQNCHGSNGVGQIPGAPDFSRGESMLQPDTVIADSIKNGKGMMPSFRGQLKANELFDITAYLRTLRR